MKIQDSPIITSANQVVRLLITYQLLLILIKTGRNGLILIFNNNWRINPLRIENINESKYQY